MKSRGFLPALPAQILLFVFFLFPVVRMLGFSVAGGTFDWYAKALVSRGARVRRYWLESLADLPALALVVSLASALLPTVAAYRVSVLRLLQGR